LLNPDFETLINNYDILVLVETKTDEYDNIKLPNEYACYAKHRKKIKKKSGGIIIIYRNIFSKFLKFIQSDSECVQWVEILNDISDKIKNVIFGCVYIPPEFSPYSSDEAFLQLEDELITHIQISLKMSLLLEILIPELL
jgi:hypothetical protein